jgi:1,4-dihydroxy-2-naphthoate octaprenyltransferase
MKTNPIVLFLRLSRPFFLAGGFLQYSLGAGIARYLGYEINWDTFVVGALWVFSVQLATHYLNEYYDAEIDAMNPSRTPFSGGSGVLGEKEGQLPRNLGILAAASMLTATLLLTFGLMRMGNFNIATGIVALLIFLGAVFYSTPPVQLSRSGYGELTTAILLANLSPAFGFLLQTGELHRLLAMSTFPLTALALALMISIEFPDYATDLKYEKRTLLVRVGWKTGMKLHNVFILSAFGLLALSSIYGMPTRVALPAVLPLPLGLLQIWYMNRIANGIKPNWTLLTFSAVMLFGLTSYILTFSFWTR